MQVLASQETGRLLSNTLITYLKVWDNLGKLRIKPDRGKSLERNYLETQGLKMGQRRIRLLVG
jgi:hypothetical protein